MPCSSSSAGWLAGVCGQLTRARGHRDVERVVTPMGTPPHLATTHPILVSCVRYRYSTLPMKCAKNHKLDPKPHDSPCGSVGSNSETADTQLANVLRVWLTCPLNWTLSTWKVEQVTDLKSRKWGDSLDTDMVSLYGQTRTQIHTVRWLAMSTHCSLETTEKETYIVPVMNFCWISQERVYVASHSVSSLRKWELPFNVRFVVLWLLN